MNLFLDFYRVCGATLGMIFALGLTLWTFRQYALPRRRIQFINRPPRLVVVSAAATPPASTSRRIGRRAA